MTPEVIWRGRPAKVITRSEYIGHSGIIDYVVSAEVQDEGGVHCVRAYVWELKAPQCYIFEKDTNNRLRPTKELIRAENQLLHYVYEKKGAEYFRDEFKVTQAENVKFGGIIIGSYPTRVKGNFSDDVKDTLYQRAPDIRRAYYYERNGIRLMTWDYILRFLSPDEIANKKLPIQRGKKV